MSFSVGCKFAVHVNSYFTSKLTLGLLENLALAKRICLEAERMNLIRLLFLIFPVLFEPSKCMLSWFVTSRHLSFIYSYACDDSRVGT